MYVGLVLNFYVGWNIVEKGFCLIYYFVFCFLGLIICIEIKYVVVFDVVFWIVVCLVVLYGLK